MTGRPAPPDEAARVREVVELLESLRCVDSTVFIEVDGTTFENFSTPAQVVTNDFGRPEFRSKRIVSVPNDQGRPGSGVDVVLWTESHRHLRVS